MHRHEGEPEHELRPPGLELVGMEAPAQGRRIVVRPALQDPRPKALLQDPVVGLEHKNRIRLLVVEQPLRLLPLAGEAVEDEAAAAVLVGQSVQHQAGDLLARRQGSVRDDAEEALGDGVAGAGRVADQGARRDVGDPELAGEKDALAGLADRRRTGDEDAHGWAADPGRVRHVGTVGGHSESRNREGLARFTGLCEVADMKEPRRFRRNWIDGEMQAVADVGEDGPRKGTARRLRPVGIKRVPMKRTFAGAYLDQGRRPRRKLKTVSDVSQYLLQQSLLDLGEPLTGPSPEGDEKIAKMMAAEVAAAVVRPGSNSVHWYSDAIERAIAIASVLHPEIGSDAAAAAVPGSRFKTADEARIVFFAATAITSQNVVVRDNIRYALEQYRHFVEHGRFLPKGYGAKAASVRGNLERFNQMLGLFEDDIAALGAFLDTEFTMKELREAGKRNGIAIGGKELADEIVYGSMVFGPKIGGGFYQNLRGNLKPLTVDLWFSRTWGRYTGTLLKGEVSGKQVERLAEGLRGLSDVVVERMREDGVEFEPDALADLDPAELLDLCRNLARFWERMRKAMAREGETNDSLSAYKSRLEWPGAAEAIKQALGDPVDVPSSGGMRRWMRSVVKRSLQILASNGIVMNTAELQASLWFPEKDLWGLLSNRVILERTDSYDDVLYATARREGYSHEAIEDRLLAMGAHGFVGRWDPEAFGQGEPGAAEGDGSGPATDLEGEEGKNPEGELTHFESECGLEPDEPAPAPSLSPC